MAKYVLNQKAYEENCIKQKSEKFQKIAYAKFPVSVLPYNVRLAYPWSKEAADNGQICLTINTHSQVTKTFTNNTTGEVQSMKMDAMCLDDIWHRKQISRYILRSVFTANMSELEKKQEFERLSNIECPLCKLVELCRPKMEKDQHDILYNAYGRKTKNFWNLQLNTQDGSQDLVWIATRAQSDAVKKYRNDMLKVTGKDIFDPDATGYELTLQTTGEDRSTSKRIIPSGVGRQIEYTGTPQDLDKILGTRFYTSFEDYKRHIELSKVIKTQYLDPFGIDLFNDKSSSPVEQDLDLDDDILPF